MMADSQQTDTTPDADETNESPAAEATGADQPQGAVDATGSDAPLTGDTDTPDAEEAEPLVTPGMDWFVLRVAANREATVREALIKKIRVEGFEHMVNRILVPTEKTKTIKGGKQKITQTRLYPGYVFVEMKLEEDGRIPQDVFFLFKETSGVGDFIGTAGRPTPMSMREVEKMLDASRAPEEEPTVKMDFEPGDHVKIKEGPFENMEGNVDELMPEQGKVRVIVTIFGRSTPIELEYWLVEQAEE
jgi:transcriptional antiterminator NusG